MIVDKGKFLLSKRKDKDYGLRKDSVIDREWTVKVLELINEIKVNFFGWLHYVTGYTNHASSGFYQISRGVSSW